jgi:hypothetical protein
MLRKVTPESTNNTSPGFIVDGSSTALVKVALKLAVDITIGPEPDELLVATLAFGYAVKNWLLATYPITSSIGSL